MSQKRRNLDREGLEVYLLNLLLAYRPLFQISGLVCLIFSVAMFSISPITGSLPFIAAVILLLISYSYQATLYLAKLGAWLGTLGKK